jgi:glucose/arabinose dehydrogenase
MKRLPLTLVLVAAAVMPAAHAAAQDRVFETEKHKVRVTTVASGLEHPWGIAFLPDGAILVTERAGRLRLIRGGELDPRLVEGVPEVAARGQGGLLDVAVHPRFAETRLVYLSYAGPGPGGAGTEVARGRLVDGRLVDGRLEDVERILAVEPKSGGGRHFGSRLLFGPDGHLYVSAGERGEPDRAQALDDMAGTVLRLTDDGGVPPDNPFVGRAGARPEVYSYGHRNPQGLALDPDSGRIWEAEFGPLGGDEVNVIRPGANYGWPVITYGKSYAGFPIGEGTAKPGMAQPAKYWVPSISPSGMAFYSGAAFPGWRGNLFLAALGARALVRLELDGERVTHEERLLDGLGARLRHVAQGPDGSLFVLTDARDGAVLRLDPAQ